MNRTLRPILLLLLAIPFLSLHAADEFRKLRDTTGNTIEAKVLGLKGDQVTIEMRNRKQFTLPLSRFSAEDQAALRAELDPTGDLPVFDVPKDLKGTFTEAWRVAAPIERLVFTPDAKFIIGSGTKTVKLDIAKGDKIWESDKTGLLGVGGKEPQIVVLTAAGLNVLDQASGSVLKSIVPAEKITEPRDVEVSRPGNLVAFSAGADQKLHVYKLPGGEPASAFPIGTTVESVAFSPDGKMVAASDWREGIHFFDTASLKKVNEFRGEATDRRVIKHLAFSPDGKQLGLHRAIAGPQASVWVWDIATKKPLQQMPSQVASAGNVAFSPTGQFIAAKHMPGGARTIIRVWDTATGKEVASLGDDKQSGATYIAFSPDGRYLACACKDNDIDSAIVWGIE